MIYYVIVYLIYPVQGAPVTLPHLSQTRQNTARWGDGGKGADVVVSANTARDTYVALLGGAWWSTREMVDCSDLFGDFMINDSYIYII